MLSCLVNFFHTQPQFPKKNDDLAWKLQTLNFPQSSIKKNILKDQRNHKSILLYLIPILIIRSNDIENNPEPTDSSYPCETCDIPVTWDNMGIMCETCNQWYHANCQSVHNKAKMILFQQFYCLGLLHMRQSKLQFIMLWSSSSNLQPLQCAIRHIHYKLVQYPV